MLRRLTTRFGHAFGDRAGALIALLSLCALFGALTHRFFELDNFFNVARQISINGVIAVGMTLVIVSGGIDLSVGSVVALCGCVSGLLMERGVSAAIALPVGLLAGLCCGATNGALIGSLGLSPFIATLGMMSVARGAAMVLTSGNPIVHLDKRYFFLGTQSFLAIPWSVWAFGACAVLFGFILQKTRLGRYALALGSNEEAVRLSGISVVRTKLWIYVAMGGLCGVASWILSARVASADPSAGVLMELEAIAAVVIGGASLSGGRGSILGTVVGVAIIGVLNNGLILLGITAFWQQLVVGLVIVAAVGIEQLGTKAKAGWSQSSKEIRRIALGGALAAVGLAVGGAVWLSSPRTSMRPVLGVIGKASGGEYWLAVKAGAERAGERASAEVLWQGTPTETEVSRQIDLMENLIQRRVSGIAIAPTDAHALSPVIQSALAKGIPVVTIDSDSEAKERLAYIGTDNRAAGFAAGQEMARLLGGKGKVAIVTGVLGAHNLRQRCEGFRQAAERGGLEVLPDQTDGGDRSKALAIAENVLTAQPDVAGFFTDTAIGGPAVAQALIARKLVGRVKLISFDTTPVLVEHLRAGVVQALVAQKPERIGELGVQSLIKRLHHQSIPEVIDTGVEILRAGPGLISVNAER